MSFEAKCKVEDQIIAMFNKAIANPENLDADEVDGIIWNFVEADIVMDIHAAGLKADWIDLNEFIEGLINEYLEFGEVEMNEAA